MKAADADILMLPGFTGGDPGHWMSRWEAKLATSRRVEQEDWYRPARGEWAANVVVAAKAATRPVVLVAHSCGALAAVDAAPELAGIVRGAFLVAPPDVDSPVLPAECRVFAPTPSAPLPFPAFVLASRNDPYCAHDRAESMAADWGALLIDARDSGHINVDSGHGPWPEGLLVFSQLLARI